MSDARTRSLIVRLADTDAEVVAAQKLRFEVFSEIRDAAFSEEEMRTRRDQDVYDPYCDHLIVIDPARITDKDDGIIGTYRMMSRSRRQDDPGFYTERLYDISCFDSVHGEIVEMGRVCIDPEYKSRAVMQLLWNGIARFVLENEVRILFGCAGFDGTDPEQHKLLLSYLHHTYLAPEELRPVAIGPDRLDYELLPPEEIDEQAALKQIPSIIRGYSRMGGYIGDGAVVNRHFNTTMVCIVVKTETLTDRYKRRFIDGEAKTRPSP